MSVIAKHNKLYRNNIEVRRSDIEGYGVFANKNINKNEIIEECHIAKLSKGSKELNDIYFSWRDINVIPLGFGCVYNSSETKEDRNTNFKNNYDYETIVFTAVKDIKENEELLIYYGNCHKLFKNKRNLE